MGKKNMGKKNMGREKVSRQAAKDVPYTIDAVLKFVGERYGVSLSRLSGRMAPGALPLIGDKCMVVQVDGKDSLGIVPLSRREELLVRLLRSVPLSSELRAVLAVRASAAGQFAALAVLRALEGDAVAVISAFLQVIARAPVAARFQSFYLRPSFLCTHRPRLAQTTAWTLLLKEANQRIIANLRLGRLLLCAPGGRSSELLSLQRRRSLPRLLWHL